MSSRYCILRLSSLGDVSHVIPVIRALRESEPDCRIDWIIGAGYRELVPDLPGLRLISIDKHRLNAALHSIRQQATARYDALLVMQTSLRANLLSLAIRAERRLGWDPARAREGHRLVINERITESPPQHQVQGFLAFARALGCRVREPRWDIETGAAERQAAAELLPGGRPTLAISPCSRHSLRNWQAENYARVAAYAANLGLRVCLLGGKGDRERRLANAIRRHCEAPLIDLVGRDTPALMLALLQRATVLLAPDSGPVHWASALGTPVVGLYAATRSARSGPYHYLPCCVDRFPEAARKYRHREPVALRWGTRLEYQGVMQLIGTGEVCQRLDGIISNLNL